MAHQGYRVTHGINMAIDKSAVAVIVHSVAAQGHRASKDGKVAGDKSVEAESVDTVAGQGYRGMKLGFLWCEDSSVRCCRRPCGHGKAGPRVPEGPQDTRQIR